MRLLQHADRSHLRRRPGIRHGHLDRAGDRGSSLVEVLVSVVLIGTAALAILAAVRVSIAGAAGHQRVADATAWLQSAAARLEQADAVACRSELPDDGEPVVRAAYQSIVDDVAAPAGLADASLVVRSPVGFWNTGDPDIDGVDDFSFGPACQRDLGLTLQLIVLDVVGADGSTVSSLELVR